VKDGNGTKAGKKLRTPSWRGATKADSLRDSPNVAKKKAKND
jgi:hypothetical protein